MGLVTTPEENPWPHDPKTTVTTVGQGQEKDCTEPIDHRDHFERNKRSIGVKPKKSLHELNCKVRPISTTFSLLSCAKDEQEQPRTDPSSSLASC